MQTEHSKLDWDSLFLGFNVGKIVIDSPIDESAIERLVEASGNYRLCYLFSSLDIEAAVAPKYPGKIIPADTKLEFSYSLKDDDFAASEVPDSNLVILQEKSESLMELVFLSGRFSRFKLDRRFKPNVFTDLYHEWIRKSLSGSLADVVVGYMNGNVVVGFITLKQTGEELSIGLIAVSEECQGRGIGKKLIRSARSYAKSKDLHGITVETQLINNAAIKLYTSMGFQETNRQYIYHIWN